ncbi:MAG TPA: GNAT family protein, partial [Jatrophihabitans sp.]|nr:GNAT family protein [Jatrophihabitans sp.]
MLRAERVALRARRVTDVPILHSALYDDIATRLQMDVRPWRPLPVDESPYHPRTDDDARAVFTVTEVSDDAPVGAASLWGIDSHNRLGHLGMSLLPQYRGRGYAGEVVQLLCRYGFELRGLHRLQLETLADNVAMRKAAATAGFGEEGVLRRSAWLAGEFVDEVIYGLLADEWHPG